MCYNLTEVKAFEQDLIWRSWRLTYFSRLCILFACHVGL
jgi:hypothetical protein